MQRPEPFLPDDPLERFLELARAVGAGKAWHQGWSQLRYATAGLLTVPGPAGELAGRLFEAAEALRRGAPWFDALRQDVRYCVAAALLRSGRTPEHFLAELERGRALFKEHGLGGRNTSRAVLAILILCERAPDGAVQREHVQRAAALYTAMKASHSFLTGHDDYPACALIAVADDTPVKDVDVRLERFYQGLRDLKFQRGNQLQLASHLLYFSPHPDDLARKRFRELYAGFQAEKLWMHEGDYDEVAVLTFLEQEPAHVVRTVLEHRARLEALRPKPSKQERFTLACNTAFLALAPTDRDGARIQDAARLTLVHALLQAQQSANAAAAAAASAAAASAAG